MALTGANRRWLGDDGKPAHPVQQRGWRNLHHPREPRIDLDILVPGLTSPLRVSRTWAGDAFTDSTAVVSGPVPGPVPGPVSGPVSESVPLSALGWDEALHTFRPVLSYSELGQMMTAKPIRMYDALATILGLGQLTDAQQRLADQEKELAEPGKRAKAVLDSLGTALAATDDDRARTATAALARPVDAEAVRALHGGTGSADASDAAELTRLRRLADLDVPCLEDVARAAERLRIAGAAADDAHLTDAGDARARADLLDSALRHHQRHRSDPACPVCGEARLDDAWAVRAAEQIDLLREEAGEGLPRHRGDWTNVGGTNRRTAGGTTPRRIARRLTVGSRGRLPRFGPERTGHSGRTGGTAGNSGNSRWRSPICPGSKEAMTSIR